MEERSWLGAREEELARCPEEREGAERGEKNRVSKKDRREKQGGEMQQEGERSERMRRRAERAGE